MDVREKMAFCYCRTEQSEMIQLIENKYSQTSTVK